MADQNAVLSALRALYGTPEKASIAVALVDVRVVAGRPLATLRLRDGRRASVDLLQVCPSDLTFAHIPTDQRVRLWVALEQFEVTTRRRSGSA